MFRAFLETSHCGHLLQGREECEPNHPEEVLFPQKPPAHQEWCPPVSPEGRGLAMTQPLPHCVMLSQGQATTQ